MVNLVDRWICRESALLSALDKAEAERDACIKVAGDALGTAEELQSVGCVEALATWAKQLREDRDKAEADRDQLAEFAEWAFQECVVRDLSSEVRFKLINIGLIDNAEFRGPILEAFAKRREGKNG